jgi:hypothetical protein
MNFFRKVLFFVSIICISQQTLQAQTTLVAGDIAITGYQGFGASATADEFSFVLLRNVTASTAINFTDNGWLSTNVFRTGETTVTWTAATALNAGTEVKIVGLNATLAGAGSPGTVTGTALSLSANGDQILAYQGSVVTPTFITAIHMNVYSLTNSDPVTTTAAAWDGTANTLFASAVPTGLTNGVNAMWIGTQGDINSEKDNARFICAGDLSTAVSIKGLIFDQSKWTTSDGDPSGLILPTGCSYITAAAAPTINTNPVGSTICAGANTSFSITATGAVTYQWQVDNGGGYANITDNVTYTGATTTTLNITAAPASFNGYLYRCIASNGTGPTNSTAGTLTVNALPDGPTLLVKTPVTATVADGTPVSATFNAGSGGTACADDYRYTTNGGTSYLPYTPGSNISTTGLAAGAGTVTIQGRRANCSSGCQGNYVALVTWIVTPLPAGVTTLNAGDIAFSSYAAITDEFSFVLLRNIGLGTVINFTNNGWLSTNVFRTGEETATWTSNAAYGAGTEIKISGLTATLQNGGSAGIVTGTALTLNINGDQILAYRGSAAAPTFISAIHMNVYSIAGGDAVNTSAAAWDGTSNSINASTLPTGLTTGTNAIWIGTQGVSASEFDNSRYGNCAGPGTLGPVATLRATLNNQANWISNNNSPTPGFAIPTGCNYLGIGTPPNLSGHPANTAVCELSNTSFAITVTGASTYQWQVDPGTGFVNITDNTIYSGATTATLNITAAPFSINNTQYRCIVANGSGTVTSNGASLTLTPLAVAPTLLSKTPATSAVADGTPVSATFNNGSGGAICTDDFRYTTDGGITYLPYTPGANISTTGLAAGSGWVFIEGRRAGCSGILACDAAYRVLASWYVTPLPVSATTLNAGDIAFSGYTSTTTNSDFSFVLLRNVGVGTLINFTDNGWLSTNVFRTGENTVTWTAPAGGLTAGTEITIAGLTATKAGGGAAGTVTGTALGLSQIGDQVLAYRGPAATPTFISAIHMNVYSTTNADPVTTTAAAWDGSANTSSASALPIGLTTGVNAIWIGTQGVVISEFMNARYGNCGAPGIAGPFSGLRSALNNQANWLKNNSTPPGFTLPVGCNFFGLQAPVINNSASLTAFTSCSGTASAEQSFTVSGSNLTSNITVTAPTGFEVSTTSGSSFNSFVTLTPSSGAVASTTIYIRMTASASGTPSGNITLASSGVTTVNVPISGTVNLIPPTPSITPGGPTTFCTGGSVTLTSSSATGNLWSTSETTQSITVSTAGTYTVTVTSGGCTSAASAGTTVTVNPTPPTPTITAGGPTTFCAGGSVTLTSSSATGNVWSTTETTQSITVSTAGTYTVTVTSGGCTSAASAGTTVTVEPLPTTANAGSDINACVNPGTANMAANAPSVGTGAWSQIGGPVTTSFGVNNPITIVVGLNTAGTYTYVWTISNGTCTPSRDTVTITVNTNPASFTLTGGGTFCPGSTTLSGPVDPNYTYLWQRSLTGIANPNSYGNFGGTSSTQAVTSSGNYRLVVTNQLGCSTSDSTPVSMADYVYNGSLGAGDAQQTGRLNRLAALSTCAAPTACPFTFTTTGARYYDSYNITNPQSVPVCATIGLRSNCGTSLFNVAYLGSFNPTSLCTNYLGDPGSSFPGTGYMEVTIPANATIVVVVHEVNPGTGCSSYQLTVDVPRDLSVITATPPSVAFNATSTLAAPPANSYSWSPGGATTQSITTAPITAATKYYATLGYGNMGCNRVDSVTVNLNCTPPTTANAGTNQNVCGTSATLAGNTPTVGTGSWSIVSGAGGTVTTPTSPTSGFTGVAGTTYTLRWTISNAPCLASTADVTITLTAAPTTANAGTNQNVCGTSATLAGNTPTVGTGSWSIIAGAGGTVTTPTSPTSGFTGVAGTTYTLRWTISNAPCTASTADVTITFTDAPTTANAGTNQNVCGTSATLAGNTPTVGTGSWSIIAGAGGTITTPTSPTSGFTGVAGTTYTLRWTISNAPCTASTSDVTITFTAAPTTANAGTNQNVCGTSATLAGNTPTVGTGSWSIIAGAGGTITTPTSPTSGFTGVAGTTYTLRWTISNAPCTASTADVTITLNGVPSIANAGTNQNNICLGTPSVTMAANTPTVGTGAWTQVSGPVTATITTTSSPTTTISGLTTSGTYTFRWTISNGNCTASTDDVDITVINSDVTDPSDQVLCNNETTTAVTFTGSVPGTVFNWVNNTPSIGLAASGTGNIGAFTATNTTNAPVVATVTVTPSIGSTGGLIPEILYYKFDGSGTTVPNLASAPPSGTATANIMGGLSQGSSSLCNGSLIGSGVSSTTDYLNTGWAPNLGTGSWTISFKSANITGTSTLYYIFGDANTASFRCFTNGVAGANNWILRGAGLTDISIIGGATAAPHTNTFVYDATLNNVKAYLDGVLVSTVNQTAPNLTGTGPLKVMGYSANVGSPLNGNLDEFMLFNRALSPVEVSSLATCPSTGCNGTPQTFTYTVNPTPNAIATPSSQNNCGTITPIVLSGGVTGTVFNWTRDNTVSVTGTIGGTGSGDISGTLINTTAAPITVTFTITPVVNGCTGTPITATVLVNAPPTITCPANMSVNNANGQCNATVTYPAPTIAGAPTPTLTYAFTGATTGSGNGSGSGSTFNVGVTTVTLTVTNTCGTSNCSFTVTVTDNQPPTVTSGTIGSCYATVATAQAAALAATSATDNCPGTLTETASTVGTCSAVITVRTTDAAGNFTDVTYNTRIDNTAPTVTAGTIGSCYATVAAAQAAALAATTATDNCPGALTEVASTVGTCSAVITVTTTDGCGNATQVTYNTRIDNTAPTVTAGTIGSCYATAAAAEAAALAATTATDNCPGALTEVASTVGTCSAVITVTTTDGCGNATQVTYNTRIDNTAPTVTAGTIGSCYATAAAAEAAALAATTATDNCPGTLTEVASTVGTCSAVITVTTTDGCGNATQVTYNTRIDNTAPTVTLGTIGSCYATAAAAEAAALAATTATDNCPGALTEVASTVGTCSAVITVTTTDGCGNATQVTYNTRIDNTAPTVTVGTIGSCYATAAAAEAAALAATTATDNCPGALTEVASTVGTCSAVITVTTTDGCGNATQVTYNTRIDNTAPTVTAGTIGSCYATAAAAEAAALAATTATDNCPGALTEVASTVGTCSAVITVTTTDGCGNATQVTYNTRIDNTAPTVTVGTIGSCYATAAAAEAAALAATTATDNCPGALTEVVSTVGTCSAVITVTTTDGCGNATQVTYNTRIDNTPPSLTCPGPITVCGTAAVPAANIALVTNVTDNCTGAITVTHEGDVVNGFSLIASYTITRTYRATDGCGNFTNCSQTITVNPIPDAVATPASQTICSANPITTIALSSAVSGTTYSWTRNNTASVTGIAASGNGNISGTLTNTTFAPVTVTFTIIPSANGCDGAPITATVLVNPTPTAVATPASQTICSTSPITTIGLSGAVSGTTYSWTRNNTASVTGIAASGSGNIFGNLTNTTTIPLTVTFTITPTANGCVGAPINATVLVNPTPNVVAVANQQLCNGATTNPVSFTGVVSGTSYNWTNSNPSIGLASSGSGNIPAFTAINTTASVAVATITVTPVANGCSGNPIVFTIQVNPSPVVTLGAFAAVCRNAPSFTLSGGSPATGGVGIYIVNGVQQTVFNPANYAPGNYTIVYQYTNTFGCVRTASQSITVHPIPVTDFVTTTSSAQCLTGNTFSFNNTSTGAVTYVWNFGDGTTATTQNATKTYLTAGTFTVTLSATNSNGCVVVRTRTVTVYPQPIKPTVVPVFGFGVRSSVIANNYVWYRNNIAEPNSNVINFYPQRAGFLQVQVFNQFGCSEKSDSLYYIPERNFAAGADEQFAFVYPVPATNDVINVHFNVAISKPVTFTLYTPKGQILLTGIIPIGTRTYSLDVRRYSSANYVLKLDDGYKIKRGIVVPVLR